MINEPSKIVEKKKKLNKIPIKEKKLNKNSYPKIKSKKI